jgi:hypothetical protein
MAPLATDSYLKKAFIYVYNVEGKVGDTIPVLFNPTEYSLEKSNEFANINIPGLESPLIQFVRGGQESLSMDLFFNTYEEKTDVRKYTNRIMNLMQIDEKLHAPPVLKFVWASLDFLCVLAKVSKKFTMFLSDGTPVRATLSVTFNQYRMQSKPGEFQPEIPPEPEVKTIIHIIKKGDTFWEMSRTYYGDPTKWRIITDYNGIKNPKHGRVGQEIVIPPLE